MSYGELTRSTQGRYDGYMDPSAVQERGQTTEISPGPVTEAGRSLWENTARGTESGEEPAVAQTSPEQEMRKKADRERKRPLTRDKLTEIAQTIQSTANGTDVLAAAELVVSAADVLQTNLLPRSGQEDTNQALREQLEKSGVFQKAQQILDEIHSGGFGDEKGQRADRALRQAGAVANLAGQVAEYFEKAKLTLERDDPFKQITSFEELMGKFNKTQLDPKFRPGGEFSLIDVQEYTDEFGRTLQRENAHPENFLRWVRERAWFYHDFDPMANIDLFKGMYIVAGSRTVTMYEILVDFDVYFAHRDKTYGELKVLQEDFYRAADEGHFKFELDDPSKTKPGEILGHYINFVDPETGKPTPAYIKNIQEADETRNAFVYGVFYENSKGEEVPIRSILANKEEWNTKQTEGFDEAKNEIMYEVWLLTRNHNMDVAYRQKGMPNETPLKETLAELYADNIWTRTRSRLLKMFNMPTTTHRGDTDRDSTNETSDKMNQKLEHQGSSGKAFQRSLAAYYHISEANAAANDYALEGGRNPFFELMQKGEVNGAEVFYKSLIKRTLEDGKFGYKYDAKHPEKSMVASEFIHMLNAGRIPLPDKTTKRRYDWEKADLVDFLMLGKNDFLANMRVRKITQTDLDTAVAEFQEKYGVQTGKDGKPNPLYNPDKVRELNEYLTQDSATKKEKFLNSLIGKSGISQNEGFIEKFRGGNTMEKLSAFAVKLFVQSYPKEFVPDANPFVNIRYPLEARDRMRAAMQDALIHTEQLDEFEAKYSEEWAYTFTFHSGISARNDMQGIGHDAWSKILNTEFYRLRQTGGGNYPGNLENLYGIHRLGTDFWQGLKVQVDGSNKYDKSMYEILTGLDAKTNTFRINDDMPSYEFAGNAMRQFYADHVAHVIDLFIDITQKHEFNFDKIVKEDNLGRVTINHAEMQKLIDTTWKHLRYGFDNNGMLYDNTMYGWWYDEKIKANGQISRNPHFGFKTLRDLMFSHEVQMMDMYKRTDVSSWMGFDENGNPTDIYRTKMGRNVFAYLIKAQLQEHTKRTGQATLYTADQISLLVEALSTYTARVMKGEHGDALALSGFFTPDEMYRITVAAGAILWMLYSKEYGKDFLGGFIAAFFDALQLVLKEVGGSITLKPS